MTEHEREQIGQAHATATALLLELKEMIPRAKVMSGEDLFSKLDSLSVAQTNHVDDLAALLSKEQDDTENKDMAS